MSIKIPVEAAFDAGKVEQQLQQFRQQINALGQQIAQANKVQFNPIGKSTLDDMRRVQQQFEALRRVSGDLNKRLKGTGQSGAGFLDIDWNKLYPDQASRARQMRKAFEYVTGSGFHSPVPPAGQPPSPPGKTFSWSQENDPRHRSMPAGMVNQVAGAGLRAMGPAGGVAANALGTGMSAGFGAGLMGLLGGMLALGVGKLVGAATEKMGQAEDNAVAYDRLKRTLGDVNVSFGALKAGVEGAASNVKVTFDEAARLSQQFAKLGNLTAEQHKTLSDELQTGVGLGRAYGLDPSQGVGVLGTMRGMRVTNNEQDSRKFALIIGETIAQSNAFAKADEVMDAIAGYATQQTRASLGANVGGYAGLFSAMTGSGIPGLDPSGTAGLLARVNASLSGGGAKGEASQFFSATIGARLGLDPFQMQAWREGGAFATLDSTFGGNGTVGRFGMSGPGGQTTFLQATLDGLRRQYGGNKGMMAHAAANHLGVNMSQALALMSINPNQSGEMERRLKAAGVDLTQMNAGGIGNLSKVMFGSDADRQAIAGSLFSRTGKDALSADEARALDQVMKGGNVDAQKELLTRLVASRDQEQTQGKDIRDSKTSLDNIKTAIADKLIPLTQEMRHGIMYLAGQGKRSSEEIMEDVLRADSGGRRRAIEGKYKALIDEQGKKIVDARMGEDPLDPINGPIKAEESARKQAEANAEIDRLTKEKAEKLKEEGRLLDERIEKMKKAAEEDRAAQEKLTAAITPASFSMGGGGGFAARGGAPSIPGITPMDSQSGGGGGNRLAEAMSFFMGKGWSRQQAAGIVANLQAESGMRHGIPGDGGMAYGIAQWHPDRQAAFARWAGKDIRQSTFQEQLAFVHYEMSEGNERRAGRLLKNAATAEEAGSIVSTHYERPKYRDAEAAKRAGMAKRLEGTPLPEGGPPTAGRDQRFIFDAPPIEVIHKNERGEHVRPPQQLATSIRPASPFGTERFG